MMRTASPLLVLASLMQPAGQADGPQKSPLYVAERRAGSESIAYVLTVSLDGFADALGDNVPGVQRVGHGLFGLVLREEVPNASRLYAYTDRRQAGRTRTRYSTRRVPTRDLPKGVTPNLEFPEVWVHRKGGEGRIPVYRAVHKNDLVDAYTTSREEYEIFRKEWSARRYSVFGRTGIAFYVEKPEPTATVPVYGVWYQVPGFTTYIYTTDLSQFAALLSRKRPGLKCESRGLLGYGLATKGVGTSRLFRYVDQRRQTQEQKPDQLVGQYSLRLIPDVQLPDGVTRPDENSYPAIWVFTKRKPGTHPVYRAIHFNGVLQALTSDKREFETLQRVWKSPAAGIFGNTGDVFYLFDEPQPLAPAP